MENVPLTAPSLGAVGALKEEQLKPKEVVTIATTPLKAEAEAEMGMEGGGKMLFTELPTAVPLFPEDLPSPGQELPLVAPHPSPANAAAGAAIGAATSAAGFSDALPVVVEPEVVLPLGVEESSSAAAVFAESEVLENARGKIDIQPAPISPEKAPSILSPAGDKAAEKRKRSEKSPGFVADAKGSTAKKAKE